MCSVKSDASEEIEREEKKMKMLFILADKRSDNC